MKKSNEFLKFTCPHCGQEFVTVGIDIDKINSNLCPECRGLCEITALGPPELKDRIDGYIERIEHCE
jgi:transcription elongation factor Elf1